MTVIDSQFLEQTALGSSSGPRVPQRRKARSWDAEAARQLLVRAPSYALATRRPDAMPVLRTLNGVVVDDWVLFHGAFAGEKMDCVQQPAVVCAHETVATLPSYFFDPQLACPATTYFKSAMGHGILSRVEDAGLKSRMLQALMEKYQPEGGHAHFVNEADIYEKELKSVVVFGVRLEQVTGKCNLGQDRPTERTMRVARGLFERGAPGDIEAIETILEFSPAARPLEWIKQVDSASYRLRVHPDSELTRAHAGLLVGQYWRKQSSLKDMCIAIENSRAWVGIVDSDGTLVAAGRATADKAWVANIFDVVVSPECRGRGLGHFLMEILLAHPHVRDCPVQRLGTLSAVEFYRRLGFEPVDFDDMAGRTWMVRRGPVSV